MESPQDTLLDGSKPAYPRPVYQPRPENLHLETDDTLVNQGTHDGHNRDSSCKVSFQNTKGEDDNAGMNAKAVDVALGDLDSPLDLRRIRAQASPEADVVGNQFFPDRTPATSPRVDSTSRALMPRKPTNGDRYRRRREHPAKWPDAPRLKRGPRPILKQPLFPDEWDEDIHPEGQLLYSKVVSIGNRNIRLHTDLALRQDKNHPIISRAVEMLLDLARDCEEIRHPDFNDTDFEACILVREAAQDEFGYYLANHRDGTIFWLEEFNPGNIDIYGADEDAWALQLEAEYWRHVTDFPCYCSLAHKAWEQLGPMTVAGAVDQEFCDVSTIPRDAITLGRLETYWRHAITKHEPDSSRPFCNWICARIWYEFVTTRGANNWGTDYARLEQTSKIGDSQPPSEAAAPWLIQWLCLLFLFNEPAVTMKLLDEAWLGGVIYQKPWRRMMDTFSDEWDKILVLSAITFAGAMAFLAIPNQGPNQGSNQGPQQGVGASGESSKLSLIESFSYFCGILCCVFSVASLVAAVNLKRDFGGKITDDVEEASKYLVSIHSNVMGYLKWGICLSLPRALFQWAVGSFCAGLVILAFQLHQSWLPFFWAEIVLTIVLLLAVVAVRTLSPDRIRPESVLKVRRKVKVAQKTISSLGRSATMMWESWSQDKGASRRMSAEIGLGLTGIRISKDQATTVTAVSSLNESTVPHG